MARQDLNLGTNANDGTGDKLRPAMRKVNENFIELYARTGGDSTQLIHFDGNVISCVGNLTITTNDSGSINLEDLTNIHGNLNVFTSLRVNTAEEDPINNLLVNGNAKIKGNTILGDTLGEDRVVLNSTFSSPIIPTLASTYDLGTASLPFRNLYVDFLDASTISMSNVTITGGTINNTTIGLSLPASARFTNLTVLADSFLGNFIIRDNAIQALNTNGGVELIPDGTGNVYVSTRLVVGAGTDTGETTQINGNAKITGNLVVTGNTSSSQLISTIGDGTPPLIVNSTTMVENLTVESADYARVAGSVDVASQPVITSVGDLTGLTVDGDVLITGNLTVNGTSLASYNNKAVLTYIIDGGLGETITTGSKKYLGPINFNGSISAATLLADQVGSIEIEVRKCSYADFDGGVTHPVIGDKISGTTPLTLTSEVKSQDTTLTDWTIVFSEGDIFEFYVNSATTVTWVEITLSVTKE